MIIKRIEVGVMGVNCYLVGCEETKEALIIDPGEEPDVILKEIEEGQWKVRYIINTHGHYDHIGANGPIKERTGAKLLIHADDAEMLTDPRLNFSAFLKGDRILDGPAADKILQDGDLLEVGNTVSLEVIHTPGHTQGSISLYQSGHLFTGDTLFAYGIGRTDFPGGSYEAIMDSIHNKLLSYSDDTRVYPGHNLLSTLGEIKVQNPFIR
ncbi:MBL fold metallo-hydrolase [Anoxybacter fermentans]|uniref:MBL fold metallo-hydrolase n=1 Tax=Anoxybacter fermentans TaxID=1323375 RepID=A0A3S9SXR8_9FIRM|nr:MBL fold metallo-hydrolase [Anoxybacter fermentans]AZR73089.1 MBL fold metallo-hydrolase [Anoxybacter fermentans]